MKHNILFGVLLIHSFISAQLTDTTCIKSRWISVKPNEINKPLFSPLEDGSHVLFFIKGLLESDSLTQWTTIYPYFHELAWNWAKYDVISQNEIDRVDTIFADKTSKQFYIVLPEETTPFANMYGEDSIRQGDDGKSYFIYPHRTVYHIDTEKHLEIVIQEDRVFDKKNNMYYFEPVRIGFLENNDWGNNFDDLFWIDVKDLCNKLEQKEFIKWSKFLKEKKYKGFQYAQKSCYDDN